MAKKNEFARVMRQIGVMAGEARRVRGTGITLLISHRFSERGTRGLCLPGEEVFAVWLVFRGRKFLVPLSLFTMILADYLARHKYSAGQSAAQIAAGLNTDEFVRQHGANAKTKALLTRRTSRAAIKQQIMRLRLGLRAAFHAAGMNLDPDRAVISETTTTNSVRYRLRASVHWEHL